ncbi:MAG: sigma-54 dependent transcriptional regulator, partial [candidate division WOR-3 bacterium]
KFRILIVEDDKLALDLLVNFLKKEGYECRGATTAQDALNLMDNLSFDLVLLDIRLPDFSGVELLGRIKELNPIIPIIMVSALSDVDVVVETLKKGAEDFIVKPVILDDLVKKINNALNRYEKEVELKTVEEVGSLEGLGFIYKSQKTKEILIKALKAAKSNAPCLILGETGTGKTLLARIIHKLSRRKEGPFIDVHLQSIPETLMEAELFGYRKGSFTGAERDSEGLITKAKGGTLFLDEIGELKRDLQVKLLKVIEERRFRPLGSQSEIEVDFRLITATNRNLHSLIKEGVFREDLYYRINIIEIVIPPLRERREDVPVLIEYFLKKYSMVEGKEVKGVTKDAMDILMRYPFPGNVRELSNIIERACVMTSGNFIDVEDLPEAVRDYSKKDVLSTVFQPSGENLFEMVRDFERRIIISALNEEKFVKSRAARRLGISERVLRYKMKVLGIENGKMYSKGQ